MEVAVFPLLPHPAWGEQRQSSVSQESPYLKRLPPESNVLPVPAAADTSDRQLYVVLAVKRTAV